MNGIHDMGGLHGFGPVPWEADEPVFHEPWHARVFCMTQVIDGKGIWNLDEHRHEIELMDPVSYLDHGYYGRWLFAMECILDRRGILKREEVDQRVGEAPPYTPLPITGRNWPLPDHMRVRWGAWRHEQSVTPRFAEGDRVRVRTIHPEGHTRVTSYTRGRVGTVSRVNAQAWIFPDTRAHYRGEHCQAVYNVRFEARELWGPQAEPNTFMYVDLSENHLEPVEAQRHD